MSTAQLSAIVAAENGAKDRRTNRLNGVAGRATARELLDGLDRTYRPKDQEGEQLPGQRTNVRYTVKQALDSVRAEDERWFDLVATRDWGNTHPDARANVVVDGEILIEGAPVPFLLFLDKRLAELRRFVEKLPRLDPAEKWNEDPATGVWRSDPVESIRQIKKTEALVLYNATDKHPAQTTTVQTETTAGTWTNTKFSGALSEERASHLLEQIDELTVAVRTAREKANSAQVEQINVGEDILGFLFDD